MTNRNQTSSGLSQESLGIKSKPKGETIFYLARNLSQYYDNTAPILLAIVCSKCYIVSTLWCSFWVCCAAPKCCRIKQSKAFALTCECSDFFIWSTGQYWINNYQQTVCFIFFLFYIVDFPCACLVIFLSQFSFGYFTFFFCSLQSLLNYLQHDSQHLSRSAELAVRIY